MRTCRSKHLNYYNELYGFSHTSRLVSAPHPLSPCGTLPGVIQLRDPSRETFLLLNRTRRRRLNSHTPPAGPKNHLPDVLRENNQRGGFKLIKPNTDIFLPGGACYCLIPAFFSSSSIYCSVPATMILAMLLLPRPTAWFST